MIPRIDIPEAGFYRTKLARGGPWCGVRIWFGAPPDPETGELLDRSHRWQAEINGNACDIDAVWPHVAGRFIDKAEYEYLVALSKHAKTYAPEMPEAEPTRGIDFNKTRPVF